MASLKDKRLKEISLKSIMVFFFLSEQQSDQSPCTCPEKPKTVNRKNASHQCNAMSEVTLQIKKNMACICITVSTL